MLVIRLFRMGKINQPFFKIVVTEKTKAPRAGRFVEELGFLNPITKERKINKERVLYWISVGAKPSPTINNLLIKDGILQGKKIPVHKKSKKAEEKKEETKPVEEAKPVAEKLVEETKPEEVKKEEKVDIVS